MTANIAAGLGRWSAQHRTAALTGWLLLAVAGPATAGLAAARHATRADIAAAAVMLVVGLAAGVNYGLFFLRRYRDECGGGHDHATALRIAAATSGRAAVASGVTVIIATAGLFLSGLLMPGRFAVAAIAVAALAMLAPVTALPALLALRRGRTATPAGWRPATPPRHRIGAMLQPVLARPAVSVALAGGVMIALAVPVTGSAQVRSGVLPAVLFILAVTFALMLVWFRSIMVAAISALLVFLSVSAAGGIMVLVFRHVGTGPRGPAMQAWMPLFALVALLGPLMDRHVFLISRVHEAHDCGLRTSEAVGYGLRATGGVITSSAVITAVVLAAVAAPGLRPLGVGLALAVLVDAVVVRAVLLPALLALFGDATWYLPRSLAWLPRRSPAETLGY